MKKSILIAATTLLLFVSAIFVSCSSGGSDTPDVDGPLTLTPDRQTITANGIDAVKFSVTKGSVNLTREAEIWQIGTNGASDVKLAKNVFVSKEVGTYQFEARYTVAGVKEVSPRVSITVNEKTKEVFFRRLFTQQFTSTGCVACPNMNKTLNKIQAEPEWADRMVRATFHMDFSSVVDPMHLPITQQYMIELGMSGLPYVMFDLVKSSKINNGEAQVVEQMNAVMSGYPAVCGVAIESAYDAATKTVNFTAKAKASAAGEFRILAFLVEDKIIAAQSGTPGYEHNNTVRADLSISLYGDKFGVMAVDQELTKKFSKQLNADWKPENMRVVVCILNNVNNDFCINNAAACPLTGSIDYKYN